MSSPATAAAAAELEELADRYGEAWNRQDLDAIVAMHAQGGIFQLHAPGSEPVQGREGIRTTFAGVLAQLPDIHFEPVRLRTGPGHWVLESIMSGTVAAPIAVGDEQVDAAGARVAVDFLDVIVVEDGLIARKDSYLDTLAFERQLGGGS